MPQRHTRLALLLLVLGRSKGIYTLSSRRHSKQKHRCGELSYHRLEQAHAALAKKASVEDKVRLEAHFQLAKSIIRKHRDCPQCAVDLARKEDIPIAAAVEQVAAAADSDDGANPYLPFWDALYDQDAGLDKQVNHDEAAEQDGSSEEEEGSDFECEDDEVDMLKADNKEYEDKAAAGVVALLVAGLD